MLWTISDYTPKHTTRLREVFLESRKLAFPWVDTKTFKLKDFDRAIEGEKVLVALNKGIPVGFIAWWQPDYFIHSLFIHPDFTGKGIGKALLKKCLEQTGRPATLKCLKANETASCFYQTMGWKTESEGDSIDGPYYLLAFNE